MKILKLIFLLFLLFLFITCDIRLAPGTETGVNQSQGTEDSPVAITLSGSSVTYNNAYVGPGYASYYIVSGLNIASDYKITISAMDDDVNLSVYRGGIISTSTFVASSRNEGTLNEIAILLNNGSTVSCSIVITDDDLEDVANYIITISEYSGS